MKRAALERAHAVHVSRQHQRLMYWPNTSWGSQVNRFRKGANLRGYHRPRCFLCHFEKLMSIQTHKDRLMHIEMREGLQEVGDLNIWGWSEDYLLEYL